MLAVVGSILGSDVTTMEKWCPLTDFSSLEGKNNCAQSKASWLRILSIGNCLDINNRDGAGGYFRQPPAKSGYTIQVALMVKEAPLNIHTSHGV